MRIAVYLVVAVLLVSGVAIAQHKVPGGDEKALKALEEKWDAASLKGDTEALGAMLADSFITTSPEGKVRTKAEMLAQMNSGERKYQSAKVGDMKVFVFGDAAVVNGDWKGKVVDKGKTVDTTERFTDTFIRQDGQWRCVASHSSTIK